MRARGRLKGPTPPTGLSHYTENVGDDDLAYLFPGGYPKPSGIHVVVDNHSHTEDRLFNTALRLKEGSQSWSITSDIDHHGPSWAPIRSLLRCQKHVSCNYWKEGLRKDQLVDVRT